MPSTQDVIKITTALKGTTNAPHFERTAFKVRRTYATLAADGLSINLKFSPDEQEFKCLIHPKAFTPVPNAWGRQGWTICELSKLTAEELQNAQTMAWQHATDK